MFDVLGARTLKTFVQARDEALWLGCDNTGTEHLLLALLADAYGSAARALKSLDAGWNDFLGRVEAVVGFGEGDTTSLPLMPPAQEALSLAAVEGAENGANPPRPERLLLGLVCVGRGVAVRVLPELSVSPVGVRYEVRRILGDEGHGTGGT